MNYKLGQWAKPQAEIVLGIGMMLLNIYNESFVFWLTDSPLFPSK